VTDRLLGVEAAETYAGWFASLADPTRVRVHHAVASASSELAVGVLAERVGISQPACCSSGAAPPSARLCRRLRCAGCAESSGAPAAR
jgi:hypothetical protein